jgi:hypothetical protein
MTTKYLMPILILALSTNACEYNSDTAGENVAGENVAGENVGGENAGGENVAGENVGGENAGGENAGGENVGGENVGNPHCYLGTPNYQCDCEVTEDECTESMGTWTEQCGCDGEIINTDYNFESRFEDGSSVSYSGQTTRHALISALKSYMDGLRDAVATNGVFSEGDLTAILNVFFDCTEDICGGEDITISGPVALKQRTISEISSGKNLVDKIAGNDAVGQHKDWSTDLVGWGDAMNSPELLVRAWFTQVEQNAINISNGEFSTAPNGENIVRPELTATGLDYTQLTQKFLLGALAFSQGADDYLDDTDEGKGLLTDNETAVEGKKYTALEHNWDEGFGYFGAAQDYLDYTDDEIAGKDGREAYQGAHDSDGDGRIDVVSEYNWGHSVNLAKRDRGHSTDLTKEAYMAFYQGRKLIATAGGNLNEDQFTELQGYRDIAVMTWEKAIAATVIHYINDTLSDMDSGDLYNFESHAKHWSEMKGFALSFQFNPRSPVTDEVFAQVHTRFGTAPALPGDVSFEDYRTGLLEARALLGASYGFHMADVETW